jgi:flagellar basal body-associated protein FliL
MVGGIIIAVVLIVVFPVMVMMSMALLAALLGATTKNSVDNQHEASELLEMSEANPYSLD